MHTPLLGKLNMNNNDDDNNKGGEINYDRR